MLVRPEAHLKFVASIRKVRSFPPVRDSIDVHIRLDNGARIPIECIPVGLNVGNTLELLFRLGGRGSGSGFGRVGTEIM